MNNKEISTLLRRYSQAKNEVKVIRSEMMKIAVERLGMDQKEAQQANLETFLDGYLVGRGCAQAWRNIDTKEE